MLTVNGTKRILDSLWHQHQQGTVSLDRKAWLNLVSNALAELIAEEENRPLAKSELTFAKAWSTLQSFRYDDLVHLSQIPEVFHFDLTLYLIRIAEKKPIAKPTTVHQLEYIGWMRKLHEQGTYYPIQFKVYELTEDDKPNLGSHDLLSIL